MTIHNLHPTWFPHDRRKAVLALLLTFGFALNSARLFSHTQVVPLLRTHSVAPTHDLPLKLPHVSQVFLQQLANPHVIPAGWVWDEGENVDICIHGQSLNGIQVKGESGWGGS